MSKERARKLIKEYELKKDVYHTFAFAVKNILEIILKSNGFKCQTAAREKEIDSLQKKLEARIDNVHHVTDIKDLAACRVLFYLESDIEKFEPLLQEEFDIVSRDDRYSTDGYNAVHYVIKLKDGRTSLPEYSQFKNMICEVQLTTLLYHAWSEMQHDIIYKPPVGLQDFDKRAYDALDKRFRAVMENHIKKASYEFEFIHTQFEKIKQGKQVFDTEFLALIERSDSNNEIYENLKILSEYVNEFGDKASGELGVIPLVRKVLEKSPTLNKKTIRTPIGEIPGREYKDVVKVCLEILDTLRYWHPDETLDILLSLSKDKESAVKYGALEVLKHLSLYNMHILKQAGYVVQSTILQKIEGWSDQALLENLDFVLVIAEELLHSSFEGTSWQDEKTMTFSSGVLSVNEQLREIRYKTVETLKKLYGLADKLVEREYILRTLDEAARTPHQGSTPEMDALIVSTVNDVVSFYITLASALGTNGHILEAIETQLRWLERRFVNGEIREIKTLELLLTNNEDYQVFRTLVGYDGKLARDFDFEKDQKERPQKVDAFVASVTNKSFSLWEKRILEIARNYGDGDTGQYEYLNQFLEKLGHQKPRFARILLERDEQVLEPVLLPIVSGIWKSTPKNKAAMKALILRWIADDKYLEKCAFLFVFIREIEDDLFEELFRKASAAKNQRVLNTLLDSVVRNYEHYSEASTALIRIIRALTKCRSASWVRLSWYKKGIMDKFSAKDFDVILSNLIFLPAINFDAEEILRPIAEKSPLKIINFFHDRIEVEVERQEMQGIKKDYDAVPYELHRLAGVLAPKEDIVIPAILSWYKESDEKKVWLYRWDAGHLLQLLFPGLGTKLEKYLIEMMQRDGIGAIDNILNILRNYQGQDFLWNVCKAIITKFSSHKKYNEIKLRLFGTLSQTGVVSGEHGLDEAYEGKAEATKAWSDDDNPKFKKFLREYAAYLRKQATYMKKRTDSDVELRKRRFEK